MMIKSNVQSVRPSLLRIHCRYWLTALSMIRWGAIYESVIQCTQETKVVLLVTELFDSVL